MTKVIFKGGYHNAKAIVINVKHDFDSQAPKPYKDPTSIWINYLSPFQVKKLERHFCGISGCCCCSWQRSNYI